MSSLEYCGVFSFLKNTFSLSENGLVLVKSCLEITSLAELSGSPFYLLPFIAAVCSFGGLCVMIQIAALGVDFSLVPFLSHVWHQRFCQPLYAVLSIHSLSPTQF